MALQTTSSFCLDTMASSSLKWKVRCCWCGTMATIHSFIMYIQIVPVSDCKLKKAISAKEILSLASYKGRKIYLVKYLWPRVGLSSGAASLHSLTQMNFLAGLPSYLPACQSSREFINPRCVINEVIRIVGLVQDIQIITASTSQ